MAKAKAAVTKKRTVKQVLAAAKRKCPEGIFTTMSDRVVVKFPTDQKGGEVEENLPPVWETKVISASQSRRKA